MIVDSTIVAMRGRGERNEQTLEVNESGSTNALTTVQKDNLVLERNMAESERQSRIKAKRMPNGNIRFFQDNERKFAVSELQLQNPENEAQTITTAGNAKIYEKKPFVVDAYNKRRIDGDVCGTLTAHGNTSSTHCGTFLLKEDLPKDENGFYEQAVQTAIDGNAEVGDTIDAFNGKVNKSGVSPTLTTRPEGKKTAVLPVTEDYRIRKLTPRECWRLMAFKDSDFEKAEKVVSSTQLYKQAGNSICRCVLMAIFLQLNIQGIKNWNDRTDEEKRRLIYAEE